MIGIIDYGAGNMKSVEKAFQYLGEETVVTGDAKVLLKAGKVVLPGVGSFGEAMENLRSTGLDETVYEIVEKGTPLLGICLGLQMLFDSSEETPDVKGLSVLKGKILKIPYEEGLKIPHMGWNDLTFPNRTRLFEGVREDPYVYFVHSYYLKADDESIVAARTNYGVEIDAAVEYGNVFGCQFHPEKSSRTGLKILDNFRRI